MKEKLAKLWIVFLVLSLVVVTPSVAAEQRVLRIGLAFGNEARMVSRLKNEQNSGYRWGYYDENLQFHQLGETTETEISILYTKTLYVSSDGMYTRDPSGTVGVVGVYHVQIPYTYPDFPSAQAAAATVPGSYVAWIQGTYRVRLGAYATQEQAQAIANLYPGSTVESTSAYAFTAAISGTDHILFQYDGGQAGEGYALGVQPGLQTDVKAVTRFTFKNESYYGGFRFERIDGEDMTVVNILAIEDYVKGIVPYEMSSSWPLEALKAQAVCARTYAFSASTSKHRTYHFDLCATTDCQAYHGTGRATALTDQAVDDTAGQMVCCGGKPVDSAVYFSSDGGATEDAKNVWGGDVAYLQGKTDPYEADAAGLAYNYSWTKTITSEELKTRLHDRGYANCGDVVGLTAKKSPMGNVIEITALDSNGKSWTISRGDRVRSLLSVNSIRFDVTSSGQPAASGGTYAIAGSGDVVSDITTQYAIGGDGTVAQVTEDAYVLTASGVERLTPSGGDGGASGTPTFTLTGNGWGHNVGMSQWGAYSMAKRGLGYQDILKFYYTDITVE